jgi:hypothetical protein
VKLSAASDLKISFVLPVWGAKYARLWRDVVGPSHLWSDNIPGACGNRPGRFFLFVDQAARTELMDSSLLKRLSSILKVEIYDISTELQAFDDPFAVELRCHQKAIRAIEDAGDEALIILNPDAIWADGSFLTAAKRLREGYCAVMAPSVRVVDSDLLDSLRTEDVNFPQEPVSPQTLVTKALRHLHAMSRALFSRAPVYQEWAGHMYWWAGKRAVLTRQYFFHILGLRPQVTGIVPQVSYDYDWFPKAIPDKETHYFIVDSDEGFCASLTESQSNWCPNLVNRSQDLVLWDKADWVVRHALPFHFDFFEKEVLLHGCRVPRLSGTKRQMRDDVMVLRNFIEARRSGVALPKSLKLARFLQRPERVIDFIPIQLHWGLRGRVQRIFEKSRQKQFRGEV